MGSVVAHAAAAVAVVAEGVDADAGAVPGLAALVVVGVAVVGDGVALVVGVDCVTALVAVDLAALSVSARAEAAHVESGLVVDALVIQSLGQNFFGLTYPAASVSLYQYLFPALAHVRCSSL